MVAEWRQQPTRKGIRDVDPAALADYSNTSLISAMVVMALAMVAFGSYLAAISSRRPQEAPELAAGDAAPARELEHAAERTAQRVPVLPDGRPASPGARDRGPDPDEPAATATEAPPDHTDAGAGGSTQGPRARQIAGIAVNLAWLAALLLLGSVVLRGLSVGRAPWGNMFEFCVAACCVTTLVYCALARRHHWEWLGIFVTLPVLLALGLVLRAFYTEPGELMPALKSFWLPIHVTMAVLAVGLFTVAAPIAVAYLIKTRPAGARRLPGQRFVDALPSPATLERLAYGLNMLGFILWTFTLVAGAIWAQKAWSSYWNWDPKEVATFVVWAVYAAYLHARATAGWEQRKAMWICVAGFICILLNFFVVNVWMVGQHSYSGIS